MKVKLNRKFQIVEYFFQKYHTKRTFDNDFFEISIIEFIFKIKIVIMISMRVLELLAVNTNNVSSELGRVLA